jgi:glycerophosphoryl diester phosphodiesterase
MDTTIIAHRGASAYAPENTLAAFEKAQSMGARWIEFDVMLSEDGEAFVFHDESLRRTSNGQGDFGNVSADYLRSLDTGSWFSASFKGEKILSLRDALAWFSSRDMQVNIEIKPLAGRTKETTFAVLNHINRYWSYEKPQPLVSSFDAEALRLCQQLSPELPLSFLTKEWQDNVPSLLQELKCVAIGLSSRIVTESRVRLLKQEGYLVFVFTVNRSREARRYLDWGVDAVFSDYPDLFTKRNWRTFFKKNLDKRNRVA